MRTVLTRRPVVLAGAAALAVSSCTPAGGQADDEVSVLTSVYPLRYVAEEVGGAHVDVDGLTPPGTEPHDLELAPYDVARMERADLVVYLSGFQTAVDDAVAQAATQRVLDAADHAHLLGSPSDEHDHGDDDDHEHDTGEEHPDDDHAGHDEDHDRDTGEEHPDHDDHAGHADVAGADAGHEGHDHAAGVDPHFWLDPHRLADVARAVGAELASVDPHHAADYSANADRLVAELEDLDADLSAGLARCADRTIVVSHAAYGYLADAYGLDQVGIAGIDPDTEPSPARLAEVGQVVRREGVSTVFTDSPVGGKVAETLAGDLGVATAVLDPLEVLTDESSDYQQVMRANLTALQEALRCP